MLTDSESIDDLPLDHDYCCIEYFSESRENIRAGQKLIDFACKVIEIGNHCYDCRKNVLLSEKGIQITAPSINPEDTNLAVLNIQNHEINKLKFHFSEVVNVMILYLLPSCARYIRACIDMIAPSEDLPYYDPDSTLSFHNKILLFLDNPREALLKQIREFFMDESFPVEEINIEVANEILCRNDMTGVEEINPNSLCVTKMEERPALIYPPSTRGLPVFLNDYLSLSAKRFSNDVIVDFYLQYLFNEVLTDEQRDRTHIFSSFFYKRLIKGSNRPRMKLCGTKLTAAERRHERVARWTKNVNIFDKDFVLIPINKSCRWFLVIICYPGLTEPVSMIKNEPVYLPWFKKTQNNIVRNKLNETAQTTEYSSPEKIHRTREQRKMLEKNLTAQTWETTPLKQKIIPFNQENTPNNQDMTEQSREMTPQKAEIIPQTPGTNSKLQNITAQTPAMTPKRTEMVPQTPETNSHFLEVTAETPEMIPQTQETNPLTPEIIPQTQEMIEQLQEPTTLIQGTQEFMVQIPSDVLQTQEEMLSRLNDSVDHNNLSQEKMETDEAMEVDNDFEDEISSEWESETDESESDDSDFIVPGKTETNPIEIIPIKQPCILIFDPQTGFSRRNELTKIRDYLACEYKAKVNRHSHKIYNNLNLRDCKLNVFPENIDSIFNDTGLFILQCAKKFFQEPIPDYHFPINSLNYFDSVTEIQMREEISKILKDLNQQQNPDGVLLPNNEFSILDENLIKTEVIDAMDLSEY